MSMKVQVQERVPLSVNPSSTSTEHGLLQHRAMHPGEQNHLSSPAPRWGHDFGKVNIHPTTQGIVQTKLTTGASEDSYEQEANQVAEQVMRMSSSSTVLAKTNVVAGQQGPSIQRVSTQNSGLHMQSEEKEKETVQTKASPNQTPTNTLALQNQINGVKGQGQPLSSPVRTFMEPRFGHDFSQVRIHTDDYATETANALHAKAYTVGDNIVFGKGRYEPGTNEGKSLLAHELTHVIQQGSEADTNIEIHRKAEPLLQMSIIDEAEGIASSVGDAASSAWQGVKDTASSIVGDVKSAATSVWDEAKGVASAIASGVKSVGSDILGVLKAIGAYSVKILEAIGKWGWDVLKSAGAWIWDFITEAPERIWRLLKHIGSGIIGTLSWLWEGITKGAGSVWDAAKGVFGWAKEGVFGLFSWIWTGLRGGGQWAWKLVHGDFSGFWEGIGSFFSWLGNGAVKLATWGWEGLKGAIKWAWEGVKGIGKWVLDGFLSGAAWVGRFIAMLLDLVGFGEVMDLLWQIIKVNTRTLTGPETHEAERVFGSTISYWQVRVDEHSLIAWIGAHFSHSSGMGVTLFHTVNFNRNIIASPGSSDMGWLIHELTHVWQMERVGMQYIGEAVHAQMTTGYVYGVDSNYHNNANGTSLNKDRARGKTFFSFNREQQGDITKHYYMRVSNGLDVTDWQPYIDDILGKSTIIPGTPAPIPSITPPSPPPPVPKLTDRLNFYHGTAWSYAKGMPGHVDPKKGGGDFGEGFYTHYDVNEGNARRAAIKWGRLVAGQKKEKYAGVVKFGVLESDYLPLLGNSRMFNLTSTEQPDYQERQREWLQFITTYGRDEQPIYDRKRGQWRHERRAKQLNAGYNIIEGPFYTPKEGTAGNTPGPDEFKPYALGTKIPHQIVWANDAITLINSSKVTTEIKQYETATGKPVEPPIDTSEAPSNAPEPFVEPPVEIP